MKTLLKFVFIFCAIPLLAQNNADSTDDEKIKSLEKELRILELQRKIEQYKSGAIPSDDATSAMAQNSPYSKEPSGFMLGAGLALGGTIEETNYHTAGTNIKVHYSTNYSRFEYGGELMLGYKWIFGENGYFGMRLYGQYDFLFSTAGLNPVDAHNGSLNLDLLFNFNRHRKFKAGLVLGLHAGFGATNYAYDRMCGNNYDQLDYSGNNNGIQPTWEACDNTAINLTIGGNFGFRFVILDNHAIELIIQPRGDIYGNTQVLGFARYVYTF